MTDPDAFVEAVSEDNQTALSRLGSSKSLYANTGGEIDTEPVLEATADAEYAAWQTFREWADDEADDEARAAFETTAEEEQNHYETVDGKLDDDEYEPNEIPQLHEYLRDREDTVERVGAHSSAAFSRASARRTRSSATSSATPIPRLPACSAVSARTWTTNSRARKRCSRRSVTATRDRDRAKRPRGARFRPPTTNMSRRSRGWARIPNPSVGGSESDGFLTAIS